MIEDKSSIKVIKINITDFRYQNCLITADEPYFLVQPYLLLPNAHIERKLEQGLCVHKHHKKLFTNITTSQTTTNVQKCDHKPSSHLKTSKKLLTNAASQQNRDPNSQNIFLYAMKFLWGYHNKCSTAITTYMQNEAKDFLAVYKMFYK